jgi:uncharacterized protein GlcG (DUF336 family)
LFWHIRAGGRERNIDPAPTGTKRNVRCYDLFRFTHQDQGAHTLSNTFQRQSITAEAAKKLIAAAEKKSLEIGKNMVIAVCDESGNLKAFSRMDGAPLLSVQIAQDKAYTAISFSLPTHQWYEFIKNDPPLLHGITHTPRLVVFGGGYPIVVNKQVVGGIGVSGGHYSEDMDVAEFALKAIE